MRVQRQIRDLAAGLAFFNCYQSLMRGFGSWDKVYLCPRPWPGTEPSGQEAVLTSTRFYWLNRAELRWGSQPSKLIR